MIPPVGVLIACSLAGALWALFAMPVDSSRERAAVAGFSLIFIAFVLLASQGPLFK